MQTKNNYSIKWTSISGKGDLDGEVYLMRYGIHSKY